MNNGILVATSSGTVNLNIDQKTLDMCVKSVNQFTQTTYKNICNGEVYVIETGSFDWFIFFVFSTFVFAILLFLLVALFRFIFE